MRRLAALVALLLLGCVPATRAQPYPTLASTPDPADFVTRAGTRLTLAGLLFRFGGADLRWLGVTSDNGHPQDARRPTIFEIDDALTSVQQMGGLVVRTGTLASSVGCSVCFEPSPGHFSDASFALMDEALRVAHNLGLRLIVPLVDNLSRCGSGGAAVGVTACAYVAAPPPDPARFFTDQAAIAAVEARATALLNHVNALTGIAYKDDPAILAWEDCDDCGRSADRSAVRKWALTIARFIKTHDQRHLVEDGAGVQALVADGANRPPDSPIDIVGGRIDARPGGWTTDQALAEAARVTDLGYVYLIDAFDWTADAWPTVDSLTGFLNQAIVDQDDLAGALLATLYGHASTGGVLPAFFAGDRQAFFYPGIQSPTVSLDDMRARARAVRRFGYRISGAAEPPMYALPPEPIITSVTAGKVSWLGAAGAMWYDIDRSDNPREQGSWRPVCHRCVADPVFAWQDPHPSTSPSWYRVTPFSLNNHAGMPSEPVEAK